MTQALHRLIGIDVRQMSSSGQRSGRTLGGWHGSGLNWTRSCPTRPRSLGRSGDFWPRVALRRRSESPFMPGNRVQDELPVVPPGHHGLFQQPQQVPGQGCVEARSVMVWIRASCSAIRCSPAARCRSARIRSSRSRWRSDTATLLSHAGGSARLSQPPAPTGSDLPMMEPPYTFGDGER